MSLSMGSRHRWAGLVWLALVTACGPVSRYEIPPGPPLLAPLAHNPAIDGHPQTRAAPNLNNAQPALDLSFPEPTEVRWNGGMRLLVVEQGGPLVELRLIVDGAGSLADRPGVAELCAELIRDGAAAEAKSSSAFANSVSALGADIEVQVGVRAASFRLLVEADQLARGLEVLANLVARRRLSGRHFVVTRERFMREASAWARSWYDSLALELIGRALRGAGLPTSRKAGRGTHSELSRIRLEHCNSYYSRFFEAAHATLISVGPRVTTTVRAAADKAFSRWRAHTAQPKRRAPAVASKDDSDRPRRIFVIDRPKSPRASIHAAFTLPAITATSFPALQVLRLVFGEPAGQLRKRLGTSITSALLSDRSDRIAIVVGLSVSAERGAETTKELLELLDGLSRYELDAARIKPLKASLMAALRTDLDRNPTVADRLGEALSLGLGNSYYTSYPQRLQAVSARVVKQLAAVASSPREIVVMGDKELLSPSLSKLAEVQVVNPMRGFAIQGRARR